MATSGPSRLFWVQGNDRVLHQSSSATELDNKAALLLEQCFTQISGNEDLFNRQTRPETLWPAHLTIYLQLIDRQFALVPLQNASYSKAAGTTSTRG